jgi:hypothetical protein
MELHDIDVGLQVLSAFVNHDSDLLARLYEENDQITIDSGLIAVAASAVRWIGLTILPPGTTPDEAARAMLDEWLLVSAAEQVDES